MNKCVREVISVYEMKYINLQFLLSPRNKQGVFISINNIMDQAGLRTPIVCDKGEFFTLKKSIKLICRNQKIKLIFMYR